MAITTDPDDNIGKARIELGDDVENAGVLPGDANLTDEQITYALDVEGSVMKAVARLAAMVARRWAKACATTAGPLQQRYEQIYEHWQQQATALAKTYGTAVETVESVAAGTFSVAATRDDGYSDSAASEYGPRRRWRPC